MATDKKLRIVFMGTPDFAVASLKKLVEAGQNVVGVITAPDKPSGRGQQLTESAVKKYAAAQGIKILQPEKLKNEAFLDELRSLQADLQIVVAFRMLPEVVWAMPPKGTFNLHGSLLPQYRGAAPINWAVINGEKETGVTTFFIEKEIDTGKIIFSAKTPINSDDNAGTVHDKLMDIGADLVLKTVEAICQGTAPQTDQVYSEDLKIAPKIFKEDCEIHWNQNTAQVANFIRGLAPYPTAFTVWNGKTYKIYAAEEIDLTENGNPGQVHTDGKNLLAFRTSDGWLSIKEWQPESKKRMKIDEFLRGFKL